MSAKVNYCCVNMMFFFVKEVQYILCACFWITGVLYLIADRTISFYQVGGGTSEIFLAG
jgi:hypothetical protein